MKNLCNVCCADYISMLVEAYAARFCFSVCMAFSQGRRGALAGTELLGRSCAPDTVQVYRGYFQKSFGLSVPYPSSEHIKLQFVHEKSRMI